MGLSLGCNASQRLAKYNQEVTAPVGLRYRISSLSWLSRCMAARLVERQQVRALKRLF